MNNEVKEIIIDLITRAWQAEKEYYINAGERNVREAELADIYYELDEKIGALEQKTLGEYEEEIEELEEENGELISRNADLAEENCKLREILTNVSEAVNVTWS